MERERLILGVYLLIASVLLYFGIAMELVSPGGYNESWFELVMPLLFFVIPALLLACRSAWMLRLELPQLKRFGLWLTLPLSLGLVSLGAILISVVIWRGHWVEFFWHR